MVENYLSNMKHKAETKHNNAWTIIKPGKIHLKTEELQQFVLQDDVVLFTVVHVARDPVE